MFLPPDTTSLGQGRVLRGGPGRGGIGQNTGVVGPMPAPIVDPSGGHEPGGVVGPGGGGVVSGGGRGDVQPPQRSAVLPKKPKPAQPAADPYAVARFRKEHPWTAPGYQDPAAGGQSAGPAPMPAPVGMPPPAFQPPPPIMSGFGRDDRGMTGRY